MKPFLTNYASHFIHEFDVYRHFNSPLPNLEVYDSLVTYNSNFHEDALINIGLRDKKDIIVLDPDIIELADELSEDIIVIDPVCSIDLTEAENEW